jgi:hypothetical protein
MVGMQWLLSTLIVVFALVLFVRAAAVALEMTGLDKRSALFQALSAFSRTGFTTQEAESIVNHPVRRKIAFLLMVLGTAGVATIIVTATAHVVTREDYWLPVDVLVLLVGLYLAYIVATRKGFITKWDDFIAAKLVKSSSSEGEEPTEDLLHLPEDNGLVRVIITEKSPFIGTSLSERGLNEKGLVVLGIERGKNWIPFPKAEERIQEGDRIVVYGPLEVARELFKKEGELAQTKPK